MCVFTTKLTKHILYRCFARFNCGIQRYKELIADALSPLCTLHTFGNGVNVGCCYRGGQGVNKKQRKPFKTWINSKNMLQDFQQKKHQIFKGACFPTGSDLNKWPQITYAWLETCKLISRTLAHTDTQKNEKLNACKHLFSCAEVRNPRKKTNNMMLSRKMWNSH